MGGDLNDIKDHSEKKGGQPRSDSSFKPFREWIQGMNMSELEFMGRQWTWANNRTGEGFVEERLDRVWASPEWLFHNPDTIVNHVHKQASDHSLLLMNTVKGQERSHKRFYFDKRYMDIPAFEQVVDHAWNRPQVGTPMFQVCNRIKECRMELLKLRGLHMLNSGQAISKLKNRMTEMQRAGGARNWQEWDHRQKELHT